MTDVCQENETREFHWLLKIVARLRRELVSLNENFMASFLFFRPENIQKARLTNKKKSRRDKIVEQ